MLGKGVLSRTGWGLLWASLTALCGCKSQPPPRAPSRIDTGRKTPLTVEEVTTRVRGVTQEFSSCYINERRQLISGDLSDYVLQLRVPPDGKPVEVTVVKASVPGQETLEFCVVQVLARLRFPKHPGKRITLNVPIKEAGK